MTTALQFVTGALENIGVYDPSEPLSDEDANRGFDRLNSMIDSWNTESLTCFYELSQSGAVQANKNRYTVGPGGDFDVVRPTRVKYGPGAAILTDGNNNRYPVKVMPQDSWNLIWNLVSVTSNLPDTMFFDPQFPLAVINLFPMPNIGGMTLTWTSWAALGAFPDLTTDLSFPPGYKLAIELNLAVMLKPFWSGAQLDPDVRMQAMEAKGNIKRSNVRQNNALFDPELSRNQGRPYNIYSDTYR
jgi:hypothetical protein